MGYRVQGKSCGEDRLDTELTGWLSVTYRLNNPPAE